MPAPSKYYLLSLVNSESKNCATDIIAQLELLSISALKKWNQMKDQIHQYYDLRPGSLVSQEEALIGVYVL